MLRIRHWLEYLVVRLFICVVQTVPIESCQSLARSLAWLACLLKIRHRTVEENLRSAFPDCSVTDRQVVERQMWEHLFLMACEIALVPRKIHQTNWRKFVSVEDRREIVRRLLEPRSTIIISGHFGNFELAGYVCAMFGFPIYTIARRLDNPLLNDFVNRFRERTGQYILPKDGSSAQIQELLRTGRTLALLGDQHAGPKGCWVDFFGRPASCHKAISLFSLQGNAPLLVVSSQRTDAPLRFAIRLVGLADPAEGTAECAGVKPLTQWYNRMLERMIRESPSQYWWLHRRWREPPAAALPNRAARGDLSASGRAA